MGYPLPRRLTAPSCRPSQVKVEFYDYTIHESTDIFYAVGRERGSLRVDKKQLDLAIRTSRVFRKIDGRWRQVHHQGSIDDPELLANYQSAVGKPDKVVGMQ